MRRALNSVRKALGQLSEDTAQSTREVAAEVVQVAETLFTHLVQQHKPAYEKGLKRLAVVEGGESYSSEVSSRNPMPGRKTFFYV